MSDKISIARLKKFGKTFELSVDPEAALKYKKGGAELHDVLMASHIFTNAKRGEMPTEVELQQVFKTTDVEKIADLILKEGEIQLTSEHRAIEREQKKKKLINMIRTLAVDPKNNLPIPPERIELALEEGKIHLNDNKTVEEQFDDIIKRLRPILALKIEQKRLSIEIPSKYAGKAQGQMRKYSIIREEWLPTGAWKVTIESPAGLVPEIIDQLNALTHGEVVVEIK
ncbi:ribosome assembly factor SBDS [Candidatus Woesearchaeota archaeon]|nr:ribosome assembly factor SBDS [Candidatus Woesearchaeota archaeon]